MTSDHTDVVLKTKVHVLVQLALSQGVFYQLLLLLLFKKKLKLLRSILEECMHLVPVGSLPGALQEEVMHWVFRNEDR